MLPLSPRLAAPTAIAILLVAGGGDAPCATPAEKAAKMLEKIERRAAEQGLDNPEKVRQELRDAAAELDARLAGDPRNPALLVLAARVSFWLAVTATEVFAFGGGETPADQPDPMGPALALLDSALRIAPRDPQAHWWLARVHATSRPVVQGGELAMLCDPDSAVVHGRQAVALAPDVVGYREGLATWLMLAGSYDEARDTLAPVDGGRNPAFRLLSTLALVAVPPEAQPNPLFATSMAEAYRDAGLSYPVFRTLAYTVPYGGDSLLAYYRGARPDLAFSPFTAEGEYARMCWAVFSVEGTRLVPLPPDEADRLSDRKDTVVGLHVAEFASPAPEDQARHKLPEGRPYCSLTIDYRTNPPVR